MPPLVRVDLKALSRDMKRHAAHHPRAVESGMDRVADIGLKGKGRRVQRTYARKIPISKTGRAKWKRSGDWKRSQKILRISATERHIVTEGNPAKYEGRLADLPTGADGVNRTNAASADTAREIQPQVGPAFRAAYAAAMNLRTR